MSDGIPESITQVVDRLKNNLSDKEVVMDCCDDITQLISEDQVTREDILNSEFVTFFKPMLRKFEDELEVCIRIVSCLSHVLRDFANTTEANKPEFLNLDFFNQVGSIVGTFETNKDFLKIMLPCLCTVIPNAEAAKILSESNLFEAFDSLITKNTNENTFIKDISLVLFNLSCSDEAMKKMCTTEGMKNYFKRITYLEPENEEEFQSVLGFICPLLNNEVLIDTLCDLSIAETFSALLGIWRENKEQSMTIATAIFVGTNNERFKENLLESSFFCVFMELLGQKMDVSLLKELLSSVYNFAMLKENKKLSELAMGSNKKFLKALTDYIPNFADESDDIIQLYLKSLRNLAKNKAVTNVFVDSNFIDIILNNIILFMNVNETIILVFKLFRTMMTDKEGNINEKCETSFIEQGIFSAFKQLSEHYINENKVLVSIFDFLADVTNSTKSKIAFVNSGLFKYCISTLLIKVTNNENSELIIQTLAEIINSKECHEPIINDGSIKEIIQILNQKIDDRDFVLTICQVLTAFLKSEKCLVEMFKQDAVTPFRLAFDKYSDDVGLCQSLWVIIWKASEVPETLPMLSNEEFIEFNMTSLKKFIGQNQVGLTSAAMNVLSSLVGVEANHEIIAKYDAFGLANDASDAFEENRDITESIVSLYRAFCPTERYHEKLIEEIEVFELFTELLEVWESDKGIVNGISLAFLDIFNEDRAARVREAGFIEVLSGVCKNQIDNPEIIGLLFQIIWSLSVETGNRDEFRNQDVIPTIIEVTEKYIDNKRILMSAIKAMWNLSANKENKGEFGKGGVIELIEKIMTQYEHDPVVIEYCCGNIRNLSFGDEENQDRFEQSNIPNLLIKYLDRFATQPNTTRQIAGSIWNLSSQKNLRALFLHKQLLSKIISVGKKHFATGPVIEQIAGIIWTYANSTERRKILADNGAIGLLVKSFKKNFRNPEVLEEITGAMCALSMYDFNKPIFAKAGVVKHLTKCLEYCISNETLREKCLQSLFVITCNLAMLPMIKDQFIDYGATPHIVRILDEFADDMVPQAVQYMKHLFVDSLEKEEEEF
eukprot:TRINITY_DN3070_c0_g1_i3.p1 TRINITY_DN3070_c0_g1~~TRINITY_DN3070_c0_g1_i3.p1  ORF type:complete len:1061 (+),score=357.24 TRINITY_DN3070_c0_g1_i3:40-3222(+)